MPVERIWDNDTRLQVMQMLDSGLSASAIAAAYEISRNAAIGRIARDPELHSHVQVHIVLKKPDRPPRQVKPPKVRPEPARPRLRKPAMRKLPIGNLGHNQCRWPVEDAPHVTGGYLFCGADTEAFQPYCPWHSRLARPGGV
jgi:hypothetical protein